MNYKQFFSGCRLTLIELPDPVSKVASCFDTANTDFLAISGSLQKMVEELFSRIVQCNVVVTKQNSSGFLVKLRKNLFVFLYLVEYRTGTPSLFSRHPCPFFGE